MALRHLLPRFSLRNSAWSFLIAIAVIGLCAHITLITMQYVASPKSVHLEISAEKFKFPDVTFCKLHQFNSMKYENGIFRSNKFNKTIQLRSIVKRIYAFWNVLQKNNHEIDSAHLFENSMRRLAFRYDLYDYPWAEIIDCQYGNIKCKYSDFVIEKHPNYFLCFTFPGYKMTRESGSLKVLLLNWEQILTRQTHNIEDEPVGFIVSIHPQNTRPDFTKKTIYLKSNSINSLDLEYNEVLSLQESEKSCRIGHQFVSYIVDFEPPYEYRTFEATVDDCILIKTQEYLHSQCGCVDVSKYVPWHLRDSPHCQDVPEKFYLYDKLFHKGDISWLTIGNQSFNILDEAIKQNIPRRMECFLWMGKFLDFVPNIFAECVPDCHRKFYKVTTQDQKVQNMFKYVNKNYKINFKTKSKSINSDVYGNYFPVYVKIMASDPEANIMIETWAYTIKSYMSDIGGTLGLWIGVSFITFFEIAEKMLNNYNKHITKSELEPLGKH